MRIAVTSQNFGKITGHAGKATRFLVYEVGENGIPNEIQRLDLPKEMSLHEYHEADHPLFTIGLQAMITQSAGTGFFQRMAKRGITVHATSESNLIEAVAKIASGKTLDPAAPHSTDECHCGKK
ncbi:Nitrogen fixation protein [Gammaproteobacteria bacterium]